MNHVVSATPAVDPLLSASCDDVRGQADELRQLVRLGVALLTNVPDETASPEWTVSEIAKWESRRADWLCRAREAIV